MVAGGFSLLGLLSLSAGTARAQTCTLNPGDVWCGVVTVEQYLTDFFGFVAPPQCAAA